MNRKHITQVSIVMGVEAPIPGEDGAIEMRLRLHEEDARRLQTCADLMSATTEEVARAAVAFWTQEALKR